MAANSLRCAIPPSNGKFLELDVVLSSLHRMLMMNLNVRIRRKDSAIRRGGVQRAKLRPRQPWWGNRSASPATSLPDALMRSLTVENWQDLFALLRRGKNTRSFQSPSLVHMQMEKAAFFCWSALHEEKKKKRPSLITTWSKWGKILGFQAYQGPCVLPPWQAPRCIMPIIPSNYCHMKRIQHFFFFKQPEIH